MTYQHSKTNIDSDSQNSTQFSYRQIKLSEKKLRKGQAAKVLGLIYSILMGIITSLLSKQYFKNYKSIGSVVGLLVYISSKLSVRPEIQ